MAQGLLPFQYEAEGNEAGFTGFAGLPLYLELSRAAGLEASVARHVAVSGGQGWSDQQMVSALLMLNLAGGDGLDDLDRLEADSGLCQLVRSAEAHGQSRLQRRAAAARWRRQRSRTFPSPHAAGRWLAGFHDAEEEARREPGRAFIPAASPGVSGLWRVNGDLLSRVQAQRPVAQATLDMDATLIETHKRGALYCYKHFKAYQPLNTWWAEQGLIVHSEFRDGNVPAGFQQLRVLEAAIGLLPGEVKKLYLRSDTAGYQQDLLKYCAEGKNQRFGVIEFAIGADVTAEFKQAVAALPETAWQELDRIVEGERCATNQQWAEVVYVPNWAGMSKKAPDYRFLAIREPLRELDLGDGEQLPFPTMNFGATGRHKLFGVVTNRTLPGDELIGWLRQRCGKSEEAHAVMKEDLAGGRLPSGLLGANAAWWAIMILALNLNAMMKHLVLGGDWAVRRMKAMRFHLIALPGRVVRHARRLIVRLSAGSIDLIRDVRAAILALQPAPSG